MKPQRERERERARDGERERQYINVFNMFVYSLRHAQAHEFACNTLASHAVHDFERPEYAPVISKS